MTQVRRGRPEPVEALAARLGFKHTGNTIGGRMQFRHRSGALATIVPSTNLRRIERALKAARVRERRSNV